MNRKIVITGATGFIGKKIINELIQRGDEITIFTRSIDKAKQIIPDARNMWSGILTWIIGKRHSKTNTP